MREILFRGKHIDNGEWVEGKGVDLNFSDAFILVGWRDESVGACELDEVEVDRKSVGEYTGLTDKNGKRIFEGDIVKREFTLWHGETKKTRETQIGVVVYSNRECGFQVEKKCNLRKPWDGDTIEVIGNIHDNPEMLEGEK